MPLLWTVLDKRGRGDTDERIALMRRYLAVFDVSTIRFRLADREFGSAKLLKFLTDNSIPFAIRLKENLRVTTEEGHALSLKARFRLARRTATFRARLAAEDDENPGELGFAAKPIKEASF